VAEAAAAGYSSQIYNLYEYPTVQSYPLSSVCGIQHFGGRYVDCRCSLIRGTFQC
jgi:hypothetical protein